MNGSTVFAVTLVVTLILLWLILPAANDEVEGDDEDL